MRLLAVVPAFNEEASLAAALEDLRTHNPDTLILVVNDGSTDRTSAVARALQGVEVLDLPVNLGIGAAVQAGMRRFLASDCDMLLQFDGDGQHRGDQVSLLCAAAVRGADVVIGSRFLEHSGYPASRLRRAGITVINWLVRRLASLSVTDATSGFRVYSRHAVEVILADYPDDYPEPIATLLAARRGLGVVEVPVGMRPRSAGRSSLFGLRGVYYVAKVSLMLVVAWIVARNGGS